MKQLFYFSAFISIISYGAAVESESTEQILRKMVNHSIEAALQNYHKDDWREIKDMASHFWRDPSSALEQEVKLKVNKFQDYLLSTLLNDKQAVLRILYHYFDYQLDCLQVDYESAPKSRFQVWSYTPPQYHATQAFEMIARGLGISLDKDYHQSYALASDRARFIEDQQDQLKENASKLKITLAPEIPIPPPFVPSSTKKIRPLHPKNDIKIIQIQGELGERESTPKTITKTNGSPLTTSVLEEIKAGVKLKPAADRILKPKPKSRPGNLLEILSKQLDKRRSVIKLEED